VCSTSLLSLDDPKRPTVQERIAFLSRIAYTQWSWEELATGEAQGFILPYVDQVRAA
jgi:hypothetical protein